MTDWYEHPRAKEGEAKAFEADRAAKQGNLGVARDLYHEAARAFATVAINVPADQPKTRSNLAIAAVATFARAGELGQAVAFAQRMLVESDALSERGRIELKEMLHEYSELISLATMTPVPHASSRKPTLGAIGRSKVVLDDVMDRFRRRRSAA